MSYFKRQTGIQTQTSHCENPSTDFLHANQTQEKVDLMILNAVSECFFFLNFLFFCLPIIPECLATTLRNITFYDLSTIHK